jgi:uncharacterized membrane protein
MNGAEIHLLLNHVPVLWTGVGVLLLAAALVRKSEEIKKASLCVFIASALAAIPTYVTGEPAEEIVAHLPGVSESFIEAHEEAAEAAAVALGILGVVSLAGLLGFRRAAPLPRWFAVGSLALAVVVGGLMARAAHLGGQIRHTEIRGGLNSSAGPAEAKQPPHKHDTNEGD